MSEQSFVENNDRLLFLCERWSCPLLGEEVAPKCFQLFFFEVVAVCFSIPLVAGRSYRISSKRHSLVLLFFARLAYPFIQTVPSALLLLPLLSERRNYFDPISDRWWGMVIRHNKTGCVTRSYSQLMCSLVGSDKQNFLKAFFMFFLYFKTLISGLTPIHYIILSAQFSDKFNCK